MIHPASPASPLSSFSLLSYSFIAPLLTRLPVAAASLHSTDPFLRKELYSVKAPSVFATRNAGKTIITRTAGTSKCSASFSLFSFYFPIFPELLSF